MEAQLRAMEKTIETSELLEVVVETEAQTGVSGMSVAGGGRGGLFVTDVLKDSPAAKALRLQEGDQLLSARVYFEDVKYEDALQILRCVEPYKVSFWLKRTVPGVEVARKPGTATFEVKGPKAKLAKLNIRSLRPLQRKRRKKRKVATGLREPQGLEPGPLDVEFSLPRFSRLRKAKSAGEVAEPKPDPAPRPSPLETKRRRVKFPRLKVKDVAAAAAARAEGRLEVGLLKAAVAGKAAGRGAAEGKGPRFTVPFPKKKSKKPREGAAAKVGAGLQAPQVELDLPLPKAGPGGGSPKVGAKGEGLRLQAPLPGLPKLEAALPTVSAGGLGGPESSLHAGLRLPTAEVAAPRVDVDLSLPKWGGAAATPEAALQGKGVRISAEGVEVKLPALEVALGRGRGAAEGPEEPPRLVGTLPALEVEAPLVDLELPLPKGKADAELPKPRLEVPGVSVKVPAVGLPKLGAQCHEELEGKLPQVELSVGGASESPRAKAPTIPGLGASLLESKVAGAAGGKAAHPPGLTIPALALSLPSVADVQLPRAGGGLAAPALGAKAEAAAEGPGSRLHVPLVSLPKLDVAAKAVPPPPPAPTREPKPEGGVGVTADVPRLDLALPGVKVPRPELDIAVERPAVEVAVPSPRLSFPSAAVPTLDINVPKAGVELGPLKAEGRLEGKRKVPTLEALGKELEISIPPCGEGPSELGLSGAVLEGSEVSGVVAKLPKVVLALGKEPLGAGGAEGRPLPKAGLEMETSGAGAKAKLPLVEISAAKRPEVASEADRALEAEARLKLPKFALPKFSISSPKAGKGGAEAEAPDVAGRGARLRMPKFGISFPRAKRGGEAEGPGVALGLGGATEQGLRFPSVELPGGRGESSEEGGSGIDLPEIDLKMPKVSLPTLGARGGDGQELEAGEAKRRGSWEGLAVGLEATAPKGGATAKAPRFKLPSFGLARSREAGEAPGLEVSAKSTKPPGPPKAEAEQGQLHSQAPALPGRVPQVELPKLGSRGAEAGLAEGLESPGLWARLPVLDLALGGPEGGTAEAGSGGREGGWVMPQGPSLGVSAPRVELGVSLPAVGPVVSVPQGALGAESRIRLPRVELPTFGRGQERGLEAEAQLLGSHRLSFGREEGREAAGGGEGGSLLGAKVRVPAVDLSLPGARLSEVELPLTEREGPEGRFKMPSVGLPKFSTPRVKGPEVALDVGLEVGKGKASGPALPLPKWGGSGSDGEGEAERDLPRLPQLELKAPRPKGGPEGPGLEAKSRAASGLAGSGKAEAEAAVGAEDGRFRLKIPSLSIVKAGPELGTDTQPLCPEAQGGDFSFRVPQLALPGVGFSVEHGGKGEAKGTPAGGAGLEADVGGLEAVLKGPRLQALSSGGGDLEGPRAAFRVPGVELSAPGLRAQAAYDVAGTQLQLEGAGKGGAPGSDGPGGKVGAADVERRPRVRLPKFGLSLPRAGLEASDGALGPEVGGRGKRAAFVLTWPKGRGAEASPGLLEGDEEREGKGVMAKLRRRPAFGLSRSKTKVEAEVNGELEEGAPSRLKVPKLGFSKAEGAAQHNGEGAEEASAALQNGAQDGKATALGKIRLPQVELSSPAKGAETDPELNLNLVREEEGHGRAGPFSPPKAPKLRAAKLGFSGLRKRNGEAAPGETGKAAAPGEKAPRFRFPRLALGPKPHGTLESPSGHGDGKAGEAEGLAIRLPSVGFSEEPGSEEQVPAVGGGRGEATAAV